MKVDSVLMRDETCLSGLTCEQFAYNIRPKPGGKGWDYSMKNPGDDLDLFNIRGQFYIKIVFEETKKTCTILANQIDIESTPA